MTLEQVFWDSVSLLVVGGVLAGTGQAISKALGPSKEGWRGLWWRTRTLHPIAVGLLLGFSELPVPEAMGTSRLAGVFWYGLAGALAAPIFEYWNWLIRRKTQ